MSHQPERTLKDCLNCGTLVHGRFCHACGQENIVPHQNFWSLTRHFIFDIFHFDGKFFDTLRLLLFRPGRIPQEYCAGRRQKYLDPIRMYLFTSAIFFLIFFATGRESAIGGIQNKSDRYLTSGERWRLLSVTPADSMDATTAARLRMLKDTTSAMVLTRDDAADRSDPATIQLADGIYRMTPEKFRTDIDTGRQDSWLERQVSKKLTENKRKSADDLNRFSDDLSNRFLHQLPYMLFVSLPLFALWLKLLYMRRKKFVYSDHAVFTMYHYIFSFILLLLVFGLGALYDISGWRLFRGLVLLLLLSWMVYLLVGMKHFYRQGWGKTIAKFMLLNGAGIVTLVFLFILFLFISLML